jgi:hypothetical protein
MENDHAYGIAGISNSSNRLTRRSSGRNEPRPFYVTKQPETIDDLAKGDDTVKRIDTKMTFQDR